MGLDQNFEHSLENIRKFSAREGKEKYVEKKATNNGSKKVNKRQNLKNVKERG